MMKKQEIRIGLIGSQSMHAWAFGQVCNEPDQNGNYRFPNARVTAVYGVDDTPEHLRVTMEKGSIPRSVASLEELFEYCNAFMILQRRGGEHMAYAEELIRRGCPVFIDKPVCATAEDVQKLKQLAANHDAVICGGSGFKHSKQIVRLKEQLAEKEFGKIHSATITYNADIDNPYDGIFFYLPHGVEIMLELFGYDPRDVQVDVRAHDDFTVYVCYRSYQVKLVMDGSKTCTVEINGDRQITEEIDAGDIFVENMRNFLSAIETRNVTKDTAKLTKHVDVILAVKAAIEKKEAL